MASREIVACVASGVVALCLLLMAPAIAIDSSGSPFSANAEAPHLTEVRALIAGGNYGGAISRLEQALGERPEDVDALSLMGFALRKSGDQDGALAFYGRALELDPDHLGANEYLGELYLDMGDIEKARERLAIIESVCGTSCEAYTDLAAAFPQ